MGRPMVSMCTADELGDGDIDNARLLAIARCGVAESGVLALLSAPGSLRLAGLQLLAEPPVQAAKGRQLADAPLNR